MSGWRTVAIGDLVEPVKSWNPLRADSDDVFQYIDLSAVDQESKAIVGAREVSCAEAPSRARQLVATDDVLVSTVRPNLNAIARVTTELDGATASTGFCALRPRASLLNGDYLFQWVKSANFVADLVKKATGASYPAVSDRIIHESLIPLPPLAEQRRIAEILDLADALRAKRREALAQLDSLTQSIFIEMFGDPATNPKGWPRATLGDLVISASDGPHVSPAYAETGIPFLSTRHVRAGEIVWDDLKFLSPESAAIQWKKCKPERGDILYSKGGTTGLAAAVTTDKEFAIWVHVALLKINATKVRTSWLESMLNTDYCYRQSQDLTHGVANRDLGLKRMVKIRMFQPPVALQIEFERRHQRLLSIRIASETALYELDTLFASLQHRAFRGEL